jgi:hypothetical protein
MSVLAYDHSDVLPPKIFRDRLRAFTRRVFFLVIKVFEKSKGFLLVNVGRPHTECNRIHRDVLREIRNASCTDAKLTIMTT